MEWVLRSPQIHSTFSNLGFGHSDGYHINENCNAALETILHNILTEDKYLRTYRRSISFGQNINKDLIPLFLHAKDDKTIELLIQILVNLTIPIECLLSVGVISRTDFGRQTVFELNNLLSSTKAAFTDHRATKVFIEFLKKNAEGDAKGRLSEEQCANISNSLLLLRNILHIPEEPSSSGPGYSGPNHTVQNKILWNIFSQSIDKTLIKLMSVSEASNWSVTMVQLVALLYKDQHVVTLHRLLNLWLEASLSESSEDNESNTSPPDRGSEDSSPMLTSDPTSDSSDTGGSGESNDEPNSLNNGWDASSMINTSENGNQPFQHPPSKPSDTQRKPESMDTTGDESLKIENVEIRDCSSTTQAKDVPIQKNEKKTVISETSDCGYGTQIENQESMSTSSNEDELPSKKPVHQKPHNPKQRTNTNKARGCITLQERKRKKIVKRGKSNIINVQGLSHKTPTDEDISNILKEFTVDFLLKGYKSLVQTLHSQILTNSQLEIDISHFFWLVTYFLKFATQIELDMEHVCCVLSYDVISYLTAEGVNLCEQFELAIKLDGSDLKPSKRRLHLVVTSIRELVQAIEVYKKFPHIDSAGKENLVSLQIKMCETEELRSLLVLLLRQYNPKYHTKQYLQDLIVTNHMLLIFLDNVSKLPNYSGSINMADHIRQFATPEIMCQYGLLLEDYSSNGEFINDCIFTLMHHVGGEVGCLISLFHPKILKTFTSIYQSGFKICDDWSDLIEYVINTFVKKPHALQNPVNAWLDNESFDEDKTLLNPLSVMQQGKTAAQPETVNKKNQSEVNENANGNNSSKDKWTADELSSLSWNYMQVSHSQNMVGEIIKLLKEDGVIKSRESIIRQLYKKKLINKEIFDTVSDKESERTAKNVQATKETRDDEIRKLCDQLSQEGKFQFLDWVQKVLLDTCFAHIWLDRKTAEERNDVPDDQKDVKVLNFEFFKKMDEVPVVSPISYHSIIYRQSIPLVPWNCEQAAICKDLRFLQLLHKLGFHMPVDTGKVFIRIPHFWTADILYDIASKVAPIDTTKLKFSVNDIRLTENILATSGNLENYILSPPPSLFKDIPLLPTSDTFYQIQKQKHIALVNYTPTPGSTYHPEANETQEMNWLELIQKSQDVKLTLNMPSSPAVDGAETTSAAGDAPTALPPLLAAAYPAEHLPEPEYFNNSLCETASVASDLTRMYVSDEDEKPEEVLRAPRGEPCARSLLLAAADPDVGLEPDFHTNHEVGSADSDNSIAEKRQRVR